jgi:hypothetical protein
LKAAGANVASSPATIGEAMIEMMA